MPAVRIALAQMNATVGAIASNANKIRELQRRAHDVRADLLVTPELALTGYPPEDLLLKEGFIESAEETLRQLAKESSTTALIVGAPLGLRDRAIEFAAAGDVRWLGGPSSPLRSGPVANALAVLALGAEQLVATKRLLPNYDVFDEQRYFRAGTGPLAMLDIHGVAVGLLICEDVWLHDGPAAELAASGARLLVVANASPYAKHRREQREQVIAERARETGCAIAYVNMVGGQDELVFDGQSFVVNQRGDVIARAAAFHEDLLVVDVHVPSSHAGTALRLPETPREPVAPKLTEPLTTVEEIYLALVTGTRDYLAKNGFTKAVVNLSGGVDSSLVVVVAADALGAHNVSCFALPSRYSSEHSLSDAEDLATRTGVSLTTMPIEATHRALATTIEPALGHEPEGLTDENLQSRIRGLMLMALSNATGAIALTTGNKSELATGYFTLYGDSVGGFAVIKDVPKTLVYELCEWRNAAARARGEVEPFPASVLTKAPSAELRPDQRDDQSLPPYEQLDPLLELYVEGDATAEQMIAMGHDAALVERVVRLVDLSEYKRRQMPPGVRVSPKAFGKDRRMPITNAFRPPRPS